METIKGNSILDKFFEDNTMSIHIKANSPLIKKEGQPGAWKPHVTDIIMKTKDVKDLIDKIFKEAEEREDGFLEIDRSLSKVIQLGPYRIVIVHPPLSDGLEMTVVKPIKRLTIEDYKLEKEVLDLFKNKAQGILISGSPGSGKTTFAQALVDLYHKKDCIIKTIESPRDLMVPEDVVQYSFTYGTHDEVRDILLLSRPDYTVYDEVRNKPDFELYKDLRLTGIGLIGVIHATRPVDSIQRFLGSIEMGIIPQVIDTVIFIEAGKISEILQLQLTVKVPEGMNSDDLARPIIIVSNFSTKKPLYEIYTFGEQIVVMPIEEVEKAQTTQGSKISEYAKNSVHKKLEELLPCDFLFQIKRNDIDLYVPGKSKAQIIGRGGEKIMELEKKVGLKIHVHLFDELPVMDTQVATKYDANKQKYKIQMSTVFAYQTIGLLVDDEIIYQTPNHEGTISITKKSLAKKMNQKGFLIIDLQQL